LKTARKELQVTYKSKQISEYQQISQWQHEKQGDNGV
jgi:hypothetical protein